MGKEYSPPGTVRLTYEIDQRFSDDVGPASPAAPSHPLPKFDPFATANMPLVDLMAAVRTGQAAEENARRREAEVAARRRRVWGPLRIELATGKRRGWWWFYELDGRTEAIPLHWWNSADAEDAASHGIVTLMRAFGANVRSLKAIVVIDAIQILTIRDAAISKISDETKAREYLVERMNQSPKMPQGMTDETLFAEVKKQFPNLSKRAFDRAKAAAIEKTGALDWKKAGRRGVGKPIAAPLR